MSVRDIRLAPLGELQDGDARGFDPLGQGRDLLFVIRRGEDFVAYHNACPHKGYEGTTMSWRRNAYLNSARDRIVCSGHGARFDIETGICNGGPCTGETLRRADVYLADDGALYWKPTT